MPVTMSFLFGRPKQRFQIPIVMWLDRLTKDGRTIDSRTKYVVPWKMNATVAKNKIKICVLPSNTSGSHLLSVSLWIWGLETTGTNTPLLCPLPLWPLPLCPWPLWPFVPWARFTGTRGDIDLCCTAAAANFKLEVAWVPLDFVVASWSLLEWPFPFPVGVGTGAMYLGGSLVVNGVVF